ncbi:MAG: nucleotide sugar dehydrogenase [Pseudomonadota bacterium]|nr:nucleotide sugar dehydrogenase [Pseudomonadota bacterium]
MTATSSKFQALSAAIDNHSATIGIVGLGYVGLPLLLRCCEVGFRTIGFDTDSEKIDMLGAGTSFIQHITSDRIAAAQSNFTATTDFAHISKCQAVILCVPTPLTKNRDPDLSYIIQTMSDVLPHLGKEGVALSLESTTYPGTTEDILGKALDETGYEIGSDVFLIYSPEREDPGRADFTTQSIPKLVAGHTPSCLKVGMALYGQIVDTPVETSSLKVAEMAKILENVQRAVNIGLMNEMKLVADAMKVDIFEVIEAAATKPFGFTKYLPGPGLGGHCIPIDPFYLTWKAKEFGVHTQMIDVADQVNRAMPEHVIGKLMHGLNTRRKAVAGSRILVLGLAYKANVDDSRESPSAEIMHLLIGLGAEVSYSDPHLPSFPVMRNYDIDMESVSITAESLAGFDAVIIATNHDAFDYDLIKRHAALIIDARGVYRTLDDKILRA